MNVQRSNGERCLMFCKLLVPMSACACLISRRYSLAGRRQINGRAADIIHYIKFNQFNALKIDLGTVYVVISVVFLHTLIATCTTSRSAQLLVSFLQVFFQMNR
jgi:hypothetical protein